MSLLAPSTEHCVGLDLGSTGLRAVELRMDRREPALRVHRAAEVALPPGAIMQGRVEEPRIVTSALRKLWRQGRFSTRRVNFGLRATEVLTRQVDLPWMEPGDFAAALRFQVQDVLPMDVDTVEVGYHLLETLTGPTPGSDKNRILLVAADRQSIANTASVLMRARLTPVGADAPAFALTRAAARIEGGPSTPLLVDIGAQQLTIVAAHGGRPLLVRTISTLGSNSAVASIAEDCDFDVDLASRELIRVGVEAPAPIVTPIAESSVFADSSPTHSSDTVSENVAASAGRWAGSVVKEIRDSLDYLLTTSAPTVDGIFLTGRGSLIGGLSGRIAAHLPLPVHNLNVSNFARTQGMIKRGNRGADSDIVMNAFTLAGGLAVPA